MLFIKGSYYNLIRKFDIMDTLEQNDFINIPEQAKQDIQYYIELFVRFSYMKATVATNKLRDDQACLLAWVARVGGLGVPMPLRKYLSNKQEVHGLARWVTTATGYLRIYASKEQWELKNKCSQKNLLHICNFICSVYAPAYLKIFLALVAPKDPKIS